MCAMVLWKLSFYFHRYNLDNILKEWENDNGPLPEDELKMDVEEVPNDDVICISPVPNGNSKKEMKNGKITSGSTK